MTTAEVGRVSQLATAGARTPRFVSNVLRFARKKPLGAVCGAIVIACMISGDLVPTTLNKITSTAGLGEPVRTWQT